MNTMNIENKTIELLNPVDALTPSSRVKPNSYGFTSSSDILKTFESHGWHQVSQQYSKTRTVDRNGYQKHLVRLENDAFAEIQGLSNGNASRPQLILLNSHDGSSSLQLFWGLVRFACLNGIIAGQALTSFRIVHSKRVTEKLPEAIEYMLSNFPNFIEQVKTLQGLSFTESAVKELIKSVYDARLANSGKVVSIDYSLPQLLRAADQGNDAYTIYNRLQEVMMRGGINYVAERNTLDSNGKVIDTRLVNSTTRRIGNISATVKLNGLIYDKALALAS